MPKTPLAKFATVADRRAFQEQNDARSNRIDELSREIRRLRGRDHFAERGVVVAERRATVAEWNRADARLAADTYPEVEERVTAAAVDGVDLSAHIARIYLPDQIRIILLSERSALATQIRHNAKFGAGPVGEAAERSLRASVANFEAALRLVGGAA